MDALISRLPQLEQGDGELYFFHTPAFLSIVPEEFDIETYESPKADHHSRFPPKDPSKFSSFQIASTSIHWRHAPHSNKLEGNSRIIRWSDGSLTLQMAANPKEQYSIPAKPLSAPQINPPKPTPVSISTAVSDYKPTGPNPETNTYLSAPVERLGMYRNIAHFTTSLTPIPNTLNEDADSAISNLRESLAATRRLSTTTPVASTIVTEIVDPDKARRDAEMMEKEKLKTDRRRKAQADRNAVRDAKAMGKAGMRGHGGLTKGMLEDGEGMPTSKSRAGKPGAAARQRRRQANRRGEIYSDDDEGYGVRGRTKEDEYDVDDGFLVGSDEEEEIVDDDGDEEDDLDAEGEDETPPPPPPKPTLVRGSPTAVRTDRERSPKRDREAVEDEDAGGAITGARNKRRMVIEDDDDE
jgi:RNA polymerase-associated protein LEO1